MRDADAHPTTCTCIDHLYTMLCARAYRAEVYLYPTGECCKKSNRDIKPDLGATLTSSKASSRLTLNVHPYSEPHARLRRLPNAAAGRGNTLLCSFGRSMGAPCPCPCRSINLGMGCGVRTAD